MSYHLGQQYRPRRQPAWLVRRRGLGDSSSSDVRSPTRTEVRSPTSTSTEVRSPTSTSTEVRSPTSTSTEVRSPTSTSTEVRSPTSTSTEVRSPTSTSTDAYTRGNITVTGGAGDGAYTVVEVYQAPQHDYPERSGRAAGRSQEYFARLQGRAATAPRPGGMPAALRFNADAPRPGGMPAALRFDASAPRPRGVPAALRFHDDASRPGGTPAALRFNVNAPRPSGMPAALGGMPDASSIGLTVLAVVAAWGAYKLFYPSKNVRRA